jgi:hypothetical protein
VFVREKRINGYSYLYLVESVREHGRAKQRIIKNLGRKEAVVASGELERLAGSVARYAERAVVLSQLAAGNPEGLACTRIGAPLLFGRLWEEAGCKAVVEELLAGRQFEFAVERAVFATVLHRLMASGSDRACEKWLGDYAIPGVDGLALHRLYRAMVWGWAKSCPPASSRRRRRLPRARSRTWSRRGCSRADATSSPSCRWCSWTPPRSPSPAQVARPWASAATRRIIGRI